MREQFISCEKLDVKKDLMNGGVNAVQQNSFIKPHDWNICFELYERALVILQKNARCPKR